MNLRYSVSSDQYQEAEVDCFTLVYDRTPVYHRVVVHMYDNLVVHLKTLPYMCHTTLLLCCTCLWRLCCTLVYSCTPLGRSGNHMGTIMDLLHGLWFQPSCWTSTHKIPGNWNSWCEMTHWCITSLNIFHDLLMMTMSHAITDLAPLQHNLNNLNSANMFSFLIAFTMQYFETFEYKNVTWCILNALSQVMMQMQSPGCKALHRNFHHLW